MAATSSRRPRDFLWIEPRCRDLFAACAITQAQQLVDLPRLIVSGHASRHVARVRIGSEGPAAFLKREHRVLWRLRASNALAGFGFVSRSAREATLLQQLERAGIGCPRVMAWGETADGGAFVLLQELVEAVDLRVLLLESAEAPRRERLRLARALGRAVARIHNAGFVHRDLYAKHVLVAGCLKQVEERPRHSIIFLDWQHARRLRKVGWRRRCLDLAALHATLAEDLASPQERLACLRAYWQCTSSASRRPAPAFSAIAAAIVCASERLLRRRRIREGRERPLAPQAQSIVWADGEALCLTGRFHAELGRRLPTWLQSACRLPENERLRHERVVFHGGRCGRLVRRRQYRPLGWLLARLRGDRLASPELERASLLFRLERHGVRTPRLLAFGQRQPSPWRTESFLLTEEPPPSQDIGQWLQTHAAAARWAVERKQRRRLIRQAAVLYRRMHEAHCQLDTPQALLVRPASGGAAELILDQVDDLRRTKRASRPLSAADLSTLREFAATAAVTRTEQLRFLLSYLDLEHLTPTAKEWARLIASLGQRHEPSEGDWTEAGSPCDELAIAS